MKDFPTQQSKRHDSRPSLAPRCCRADSPQAHSLIAFVFSNFAGGGAGKVYFLGFCSGKKYQSGPPAWDCLAEIMEISVIVCGEADFGQMAASREI